MRSTRSVGAGVAAWTLLLAGGAAAQEAGEGAPSPAEAVRTRFATAVPGLLERHRVEGAAVAVVEGGEVAWAEGYGLADVAAGRRVTPDTLFNAGSISKAVSAWGVMRLVERDLLDLDEPVASYLTRWRLPESEHDTDGITLRRVLSHTAGLTMHSIPGFEASLPLPPLEAILSGDYEGSVYTTAGTPVELFAAPGTAWRYSGAGFVLTELVVEERTLEPFADYMRREVLRPLGMTHSRYGWDESLRESAAVPYDGAGRPCTTYRFSGAAGAGLYTSVVDLARFAAAGLRGPGDGALPGRGVLAPGTFAAMIEPVPLADGTPGRCGIAYFLAPSGAELREANHSGSNYGWQSLMVSLPDRGRAIAILCNSDNALPVLRGLTCLWGELVGEALSDCP